MRLLPKWLEARLAARVDRRVQQAAFERLLELRSQGLTDIEISKREPITIIDAMVGVAYRRDAGIDVSDNEKVVRRRIWRFNCRRAKWENDFARYPWRTPEEAAEVLTRWRARSERMLMERKTAPAIGASRRQGRL